MFAHWFAAAEVFANASLRRRGVALGHGRSASGCCRFVLFGALSCGLLTVTSSWADGTGNDLLPDIPLGPTTVRLDLVATVPSSITDLARAPDSTDRIFVVSPNGVIRVIENGTLDSDPFLSIVAEPADRALVSVAFHPQFASNDKLYVITGESLPNPSTPHYVAPQVPTFSAFDSVVVEYLVDAADPGAVDVSTRRELLRIGQPERQHVVDDLTFGLDGYLYIAVGDGGETRSGLPFAYQLNAQNTDNPYGSVLRIDVDTLGINGRYGIPSDNPFAAGVVPELFAWGLRNPWSMSTDLETGSIYTGVNGDFTIEWIVEVELGANYGWPDVEGSFAWDPATGDASVDASPNPAFTLPIAEYDHNTGQQGFGSVIGGYVYRGSAMPELYGRYVFLDWLAAELIALDLTTGELELIGVDGAGVLLVSSTAITMGQDPNGELLIGTAFGEVLRLVPTAPSATTFLRSDCNADGASNLADAVCALGYLFQATPNGCVDAIDSNDDGVADISDPVYLLSYQFASGPVPPTPFSICGIDATADALGCGLFLACP